MPAGSIMLANKICPELGPRLAAMTWDQIETMIKQFIAEDDCERAPWATKQIIEWARQQNYQQDPIKFLSNLHRKLEEPGKAEIHCEERGIDLRIETKDKLSFYKGVKTPVVA